MRRVHLNLEPIRAFILKPPEARAIPNLPELARTRDIAFLSIGGGVEST